MSMLKIQVYKWYGLRLGKQHSILRSLTQLLEKRRWHPGWYSKIFWTGMMVLPMFSEVGAPEQISWLETGVSVTNFCQNLCPRSWNLAEICKKLAWKRPCAIRSWQGSVWKGVPFESEKLLTVNWQCNHGITPVSGFDSWCTLEWTIFIHTLL